MHRSMKVARFATALGVLAVLLPGCKRSPPAAPAAPTATAGTTTPGEPPKELDMEAMHAAAAATSPAVDEQRKKVFAYQVTLKKVEGYLAALKEIRAAGAKDETLMKRLREPAPPDETPPQMAKRLEGIGPIKGILARRGLDGMDLLLLPQAVVLGRNAVAAEQRGEKVKPEETNVSSLELHRADYDRLDQLTAAFMAEQRALAGR